MENLTIDITYGAKTKTLKYKGNLPEEFLMYLLNDLGFDTKEWNDIELSAEHKKDLKARLDAFKAGNTKSISLEELDKRIAKRKR